MKRPTPVELVYGRSGTGKTTWWCKLAEHLHATSGLKTRCYMGDGGVQTVIDSGLIDDGIVEVFQYNTRPHPLETCRLICEGHWPSNEIGVLQKMDFAGYGLFVFEGLTAMATYLMSNKEGGLSEQAARGPAKALGGGLDAPFRVVDGQFTFGGVSQSGYGFVQRLMLDLIEATRGFPGMVIWTAHQRDVEDAETRERLIGPDVAGKALTTKIGASFGNTIHLDTATARKKVRDAVTAKDVEVIELERRAYFREHFDPDQQNFVRYYANNRCWDPAVLPKAGYLTPPDPVRFYALLKEARKRRVETT